MVRGQFFRVTLLGYLLAGCDNPFSYSPFETNLDEVYLNTTARNLSLLEARDTLTRDTIRIALISDTHYHFNETRDVINSINSRGDISFVIATGDITENGLKKEYEIFHDMMGRLHVPYVTVIGNHDYLANGGDVYRQMFGEFNYAFTFNQVRFVMFDNVIWESNKDPDYAWLEETLTVGTESAGNRTIVFSHIPPFDGQLAQMRDFFHSMLLRHHIALSIHGHRHSYFNDFLVDNNVRYVTVGSPQKRGYAMLTITRERFLVEQIPF